MGGGVLDELVAEVELSVEEVLVVHLHDVLDLVEVFFGEFVAGLEDAADLVVDVVERVEVFLFEVPFLGLVGQ